MLTDSVDGPSIAASTAAATFRLPAPAPINPTSGMKLAECCSATFTCAGLSFEFASSISATAPLTTPADMLVPFRIM